MIKQIQSKKIEELEIRLDQAHKVINELIYGMDCTSPAIRALVKDVAVSYMKVVKENTNV